MYYTELSDLSIKELLSITLREKAANELVEKFGSLKSIVHASKEEIAELGISKTTYKKIKAVFELSRRYASENPVKTVIRRPMDIVTIFSPQMDWLEQEVFRTIHLSTKNTVIATPVIAVGTLNSCPIHPREVFRGAVNNGAAGIIAVHNHPSGDPTPSQDDLLLTNRLKEAGEILGIQLIDHIIIGTNGNYASLKERGQL